MRFPYENQGYPPPQNAGGYGNPNIPPDLNQTICQLNSIAAGQAATTDMLMCLKQAIERMLFKNDLAQVQKEQAVFNKEEAFSSVEETTLGLVTYGKTCRPHVILPIHLEGIIHVQMDPHYRQESFHLIFFLNDENPLIISPEEWKDPELLLDALSSATGCTVQTYVSRKKTAQMLRNYFVAHAKKLPVSFYAGWSKTSSGWVFQLMNGSTHGNDDTHNAFIKNISSSGITTEYVSTASSTLTTLNQVIRLMSCITNTDLGIVLFNWIHAAALFSLLQKENFAIPMGLCLYSSDPRIVSSLEMLMCWYNDKPISMNLSPEEFAYQITTRKDQPLTLVDTANQTKNADFLLSAMSSGQIPSAGKHTPQEIQALPTVISNTLGSICYSPLFMLIEVTACDLPPNSLAQFGMLRKYLPDYLMAFCSYTKKHVEELTIDIETEIYAAHSNCPADYPISHEALNTFGILSGIQKFVWNFHRDLVPPTELLEKLRAIAPQKLSALLTDTLSKSTDYSDTNTAIASQFCSIVSCWITDGQLDLRNLQNERINKARPQSHGIIYRDTESHYITRIALTAICKAVGNSSPRVLRALGEVGVLAGPLTHDTTYQTRKTIKGHSRAFYKLDSTMMDEYSKIEG